MLALYKQDEIRGERECEGWDDFRTPYICFPDRGYPIPRAE